MSKMFKLEIECDNDAFGNNTYSCADEIARILRGLADAFERNGELYPNSAQWVRDINGNRVGTYKYKDRDLIRLGR